MNSTFETLSNAQEIARELGWSGKQVPYAIALAMTRLAQGAQGELRDDVVRRFISRGNYVRNSIRIVSAKKGARHPEAKVFTSIAPLYTHVVGGARASASEKPFSAVPFASRKTPTSKTPRHLWPKALLRKKTGYYQVKFANGDVGVFERLKKQQNESRLSWLLKKHVEIKKSWPWNDITREHVDEHVLQAFTDAWDIANKTARR